MRCCVGKILFGFGDSLKSTIVYKTFDINEDDRAKAMRQFREIAYLLWQKYIKTYAPLEINISSQLRAYFGELMQYKHVWIVTEEMSAEDLYTLFDSCCFEMYTLMGHSLSRFLISDEFMALRIKLSQDMAVSIDLSPSTLNSRESEFKLGLCEHDKVKTVDFDAFL